ncbi:hypothetical protein [Burkholderia gladioli]|uniref:hypothetical protein n=1 Tax=Burkholderia gladioli TaxID=28095 RepID=UPI0016414051|nr:hypothetical protein [Burkholderia gladioli]
MSTIYTSELIDGDFVAFWQTDDNHITIYAPSKNYEKFQTFSLREWPRLRELYETSTHPNPEEFKKYSDTINAAWHFAGQRGVHIDRIKAKPSKQKPGKFHPRVWRGYFTEHNWFAPYIPIDPIAIYGKAHYESIVAASSLFSQFTDVFRFIEPAPSNLIAFGHKLRELLILACTEIEACWRAVLFENGIERTIYSTKDFIKLSEPLRLNTWSIRLKDYPELGDRKPFESWHEKQPTKSLAWYDAYNAVKHNREKEFQRATFDNVLNAMGALHIMQAAQWGPQVFDRMHDNRFTPFFTLTLPKFETSDVYIPCLDGIEKYTPTPLFKP